jgi:L-fuconolactonase
MIDTHVHFWKYDAQVQAWIGSEMKTLQRDFLPPQLIQPFREFGIDGCVAVQAEQSEEETAFLIDQAREHTMIKGVVGWVNLRAQNLSERLTYYSEHAIVKGFRHVVQIEPKGFLLQLPFIQGVQKLSRHDFTYDLLIYHHQLEEALQFVHKIRNVKVVVDHIGKPSIRTGEKTHWELNLAAMATFENAYCKLSGLVTEAHWKQWKFEDIEPFLDEVMETFGPSRVMYGSDWPLCLLATNYAGQLSVIKQYISRLSPSEQQDILHNNALAFYRLQN